MRWPDDAEGWPMAEHSRFVLQRPHRWHVQELGTGPSVLLLHGAGGATQSFRGLAPLLAATHHVIAVDLPGQGFTQLGAQQRCGLDHMAEDVLALCRNQGWKPSLIVGHSAGTALGLRLVELGLRPQLGVVGINAALDSFKGVAGWLFPMMAKALAISPFSARMFAGSTTRSNVRTLIKGTGSTLDADGLELYYRLASDYAHVDATLSMMAQWSLNGLRARLSQLDCPVHLIVGMDDLAVPGNVSHAAAAVLPSGRVTELPGLGHLAHEEAPERVLEAIVTK